MVVRTRGGHGRVRGHASSSTSASANKGNTSESQSQQLALVDDAESLNMDLYRKFMTIEKSEAVQNRQMTEAELKTLCLHKPCRVLAYRWNLLHDYTKHLESQGRLQNKNLKAQQRLLTKAVTRHVKTSPYTDKEIKELNQEEWSLRKMKHIMLLDSGAFEQGSPSANSSIAKDKTNTAVEPTLISTNIAKDQPLRDKRNSIREASVEHDKNDKVSSKEIIVLSTETQELLPTEHIECMPPPSNERQLIVNNTCGTASSSSINTQLCEGLMQMNSESLTLGLLSPPSVILSQENPIGNSAGFDEFSCQIPLTSTQSNDPHAQPQDGE